MVLRKKWAMSLLWAAAMAAASGLHAASLDLPPGGYAGPLETAGGRPALQVTVDGKGPFTFVLDTGAAGSMVDAALARELGLPMVGRQRIGAPGLEGTEVEVFSARTIEFDGVVIGAPRLVGLDLAEMTGGSFVGVLALGALSDATVTLDFAAGRLALDRTALERGGSDVIELAESPIVEFPISVGGRRLLCHLDTGSPGGLTFPRRLLEGLEVVGEPVEVGRARLVGGESPVWSMRIAETVTIGSLSLPAPEIRVLDLDLPAVNLGSALLSGMVVRVDQSRGLISLRPSDAPAAAREPRRPSAGPRFGLRAAPGAPGARGLPLVDGGLRVDGVEPGSRAEAAGLAGGDLLIAIAGRDLVELDAPSLGALLASPEAFSIVVRRNGTLVELAVPAA